MTHEEFADQFIKRRLAVAEELFVEAYKDELIWGKKIDAEAIGTRAALMTDEEIDAFFTMRGMHKVVNGDTVDL